MGGRAAPDLCNSLCKDMGKTHIAHPAALSIFPKSRPNFACVMNFVRFGHAPIQNYMTAK
jgi:hypothetical protein